MKKFKMALAFIIVLAALVGIMYLTWVAPIAKWFRAIINIVLLFNMLVIIKMGISILSDKEEKEKNL